MKLTAARRRMLEQLVKEPGPYADYYPPLKWLLDNGYAECIQRDLSTTYQLTAAGKRLYLLEG